MSLQHGPMWYNIVYTALEWQKQEIHQSFESQKAPLISPWWESYGLSIVRIWGQMEGVIMAPHYMMTSSNGSSFRVTVHLCGEFTGPRWIPRPKASDAGFDVFFDLRPNKPLSKQFWCWWFETPSRPWWRHRNDIWHATYNSQPVVRIDGIVCPSAIHFYGINHSLPK